MVLNLKRILIFVFLIFSGFSVFSQSQIADRKKLLEKYIGEWKSIDPATRHLTKLIISNDNGFKVRAFGSCHPKDCDFGTTKIYEIANLKGTENNSVPFDYGLAKWRIGESDFIIIIRPDSESNSKLNIETIRTFDIINGVGDYHRHDVMIRK